MKFQLLYAILIEKQSYIRGTIMTDINENKTNKASGARSENTLTEFGEAAADRTEQTGEKNVKSLEQLNESSLRAASRIQKRRASKGSGNVGNGKNDEKRTAHAQPGDSPAAKARLGIGGIIGRTFAVLLAAVVLTLFALLSVIFVLERGPSPTAKRLFVLSVKETSAGGFLADIFLSDSEVEAIMNEQSQSVIAPDDITDSSLIKIPGHGETGSADTEAPKSDSTGEDGAQTGETEETDKPSDEPGTVPADSGIVIEKIKKSTFNGVVMRISDPTRVFLGTPESYGQGSVGLTLRQMIDRYGAVGGINGGGFYDPNGSGTGGIPDGLVIDKGELVWGNPGSSYNVIGFDGEGILHVGSMTAARALELGIKYACSFGPTLIINGVPCNSRGDLGGGMNPRTAIGQCADGTVLMVVINGRSLGSLGATYDDLTELFVELGAVNAANLDGGSSSLLMYNGEFLNTSASMIGERELPTTFLVK